MASAVKKEDNDETMDVEEETGEGAYHFVFNFLIRMVGAFDFPIVRQL